MPKSDTFIIIGAALAGASAAKALREEGFGGRVLLIGAEKHLPYIRPPLSKEFLQGNAERDAVYVEGEAWYREHDIDLMIDTTVTAVDSADRTVILADDHVLGYDRLLLTTGSRARRLQLPGAELAGVHYLRTLDDSESLRTVLAEGGHQVLVVGSGWIGMEVAASAKALGNDVTVLMRDRLPLAGALGDQLGTVFANLHADNGVVLRPAVAVAAIHGSDGHLTGVELVGGEMVEADVIVAGIGAEPNLELAACADLDIDDGVLVDASLRSSNPAIFAAGDIANAFHPVVGRRLRSEHWANALNQGPAAARSMLGQRVSYDEIPYFYTDQFDLGMEYSGYAPLARGADVVYRGDVDAREFIAFWVAADRVVAGMNVNIWDVNDAVQGIIRRSNRVDRSRLADPDVPLDEL
jgi:NADPH-dependent 2,4-dienoyl-CoA reductase/sulfur reductase-like enzyme